MGADFIGGFVPLSRRNIVDRNGLTTQEWNRWYNRTGSPKKEDGHDNE